MKKIQKINSGFTLVELLVVISIIGLLSSFAVVSLNSARGKARNALRRGDMSQIRTALNLFYDDNLSFPICGSWDDGDEDFGASVEAGSTCYNTTLTAALTGGTRPFMGVMPVDPKNPSNDPSVSNIYLYRYVSDNKGSMYALVYRVEENEVLQNIRGW